MTRTPWSRTVAALGLALGLSGAALAATEHAHDASGVALEMTLDNGQKWRTDEALRRGMADIRAAVAAALPQIHAGRFAPADFAALADRIEGQVNEIVATCKLPEEADLQLHIALTRVLDGIAGLRGEGDRMQGAVAVVEAVNAYGEHFDHPGWRALGH